MTQLTKSWVMRNGWQMLNAALLTMVGSMVLWLITITNERLDKIEIQNDYNAIDINDLQNMCENLVEAYNGKRVVDDEQNKQILELWKSQRRSGNSADSYTLK